MAQFCRGFSPKLFLKIMMACSARAAQLDVNKPLKRTKTALKLILSFTFDGKDRCIEYSVV